MSGQRTSIQNAYETTLTADMGATDLTASVATIGSLTSPAILVIEPENDLQREYVLFDGTFGGSAFAASDISRRYLDGSAAASGLIHPNGSVVASVPTKQHFADIHDRIDTTSASLGTLYGRVYNIELGYTVLVAQGTGYQEWHQSDFAPLAMLGAGTYALWHSDVTIPSGWSTADVSIFWSMESSVLPVAQLEGTYRLYVTPDSGTKTYFDAAASLMHWDESDASLNIQRGGVTSIATAGTPLRFGIEVVLTTSTAQINIHKVAFRAVIARTS